MSNRYTGIKVISNNLGRRYYVNNIYPDIPVSIDDIYIIPTAGDRLDLLAHNYYNDSSLYWIIASANELSGDSLIPPPGIQLRIPVSIEDIKNQYSSINANR
jgi:hypothetical protein